MAVAFHGGNVVEDLFTGYSLGREEKAEGKEEREEEGGNNFSMLEEDILGLF